MEVGIACDLRSDFEPAHAAPEDRLEEYDSESTLAAIEHALEHRGHRVRRLGGGRSFLERVLERPPELVFNIAEGSGGRSREAHVPSVLEMLRIPYTHSDPLTLAVTLDKAVAKRLVAAAGVPTPHFAVLEREAQAGDLDLAFPVIAKPLWEGSSMGIRTSSRAADAAALRLHLQRLLGDYGQPVLVEEFCPGPEYTVGILGTGAEAHLIGIMEIAPRDAVPEEFVYSLEVKRAYETAVAYHVPPPRPAREIEAAGRAALAAYRALGCRDVGRVDLRTGADGEPKFLEVNPLPGLNPVTSDLVILAARCGIDHGDLIGRIVDEARSRQGI